MLTELTLVSTHVGLYRPYQHLLVVALALRGLERE